ncbi:MAG: hypothetical protein U9N14_00275 [Pseudomonadota bacterium]|nr:hypothetical protein [Pseudomonadota bacterium]
MLRWMLLFGVLWIGLSCPAQAVIVQEDNPDTPAQTDIVDPFDDFDPFDPDIVIDRLPLEEVLTHRCKLIDHSISRIYKNPNIPEEDAKRAILVLQVICERIGDKLDKEGKAGEIEIIQAYVDRNCDMSVQMRRLADVGMVREQIHQKALQISFICKMMKRLLPQERQTRRPRSNNRLR